MLPLHTSPSDSVTAGITYDTPSMELHSRFSHIYFSRLKSLPFQPAFQVVEEAEVTWCQVRRVRNLSNNWYILHKQENLDIAEWNEQRSHYAQMLC